MNRQMVLFSLFLLLHSTFGWAQGSHIEAIQARLFLSHSGTFSDPITDKTKLWNTLIGEGFAAGEPSGATLVDVILSGKPDSYQKASIVVLEVRSSETKKLVSRFEQDVGVFSPEGRFHVGFWLANTGCLSLSLTARIKGAKRTMNRVLPFDCGE